MNKLLTLSFPGGVVTDVIDMEGSFGKMFYLGHESVFFYDNEKQEKTDEIIGYEMLVYSQVTKKSYKINFKDSDIDLPVLQMRDEVILENPTVKFYHDVSAFTQGATVSISAENVRKAGNTQNNNQSSKKPEQQQKPKEQQ